jgi:hypothetical protein
MSIVAEFRCPWCGCWMSDAHPECAEAAADQLRVVRRLETELGAVSGYMLNAKIDLQTSTKAAAIRTLDDGINRAMAALEMPR